MMIEKRSVAQIARKISLGMHRRSAGRRFTATRQLGKGNALRRGHHQRSAQLGDRLDGLESGVGHAWRPELGGKLCGRADNRQRDGRRVLQAADVLFSRAFQVSNSDLGE